VEKLEAEIASSDVIALDTKLFNLYTEAPRNYSIVVVLTATEPGQACDLCQYVFFFILFSCVGFGVFLFPLM